MVLGYWRIYVALLVFGMLLFLPGRGSVHLFDWDEINFAEVSREMVVSGWWWHPQVDFHPFYEKPPLFFWVQALSMVVGGVNEASARLPNALLGIIVGLVLFRLGTELMRSQVGVVWSLLMMTSFLPFFYFRSGIIDPLLNFLTFLSLWFVYRGMVMRRGSLFFVAGVLSGLGLLTKGPVSPLMVLVTWGTVWLLVRWLVGESYGFPWRGIVLWLVGFLPVGSSFFVADWFWQGGAFTRAFLAYHIRLVTTADAGHRGFLLFHPVVLLVGVYPASVLALLGMVWWRRSSLLIQLWNLFMMVWLGWVVVVFTVVKTKIIHYSSMAYYPLTWLGAYAVGLLVQRKASFPGWVSVMLVGGALLYGLVLIAGPVLSHLKRWWLSYVGDAFAYSVLSAMAPFPVTLIFLGLTFLAGSLIFFFSYRGLPVTWCIYASLLNGFTAYMILAWYAPPIELYLQGLLIERYKALPAAETEVIPINFKTYAPYFYLGGEGVVPPERRRIRYRMWVYKKKGWEVPDSIRLRYDSVPGFYFRVDTLGVDGDGGVLRDTVGVVRVLSGGEKDGMQ